MIVNTVGDLLGKYDTAEIRCLYSDNLIVCKMKRLPDNNMVEIDPIITVKVVVSANAQVKYEPWVMDRGNMLFDLPNQPSAKLCDECDVIHYPDGSKKSVESN